MSLNLIYITNICRHDCRMSKEDLQKVKDMRGKHLLCTNNPLSHNKGLSMMLRNESISFGGWLIPKLVLTFNFSTSLSHSKFKVCLCMY